MAGDETDWSDKHFRDALVGGREYMWSTDTVELLAKWVGMRNGMTVVDVGCGLGYLGYTYWPFFGQGGRYLGVDRSRELVSEAESATRAWAHGGKAEFSVGDAYNLPFGDGVADLVMCQTLLMHLSDPSAALEEMVRILKPGGRIFCMEPDNVGADSLQQTFHGTERPIDVELLLMKVALYCNLGIKRMGKGDWRIGAKVPHLLSEMGMEGLDVRMNDSVVALSPPYEGDKQGYFLNDAFEKLLDPEASEFHLTEMREAYFAGGGTEEDFLGYERIKREEEEQARRAKNTRTLRVTAPGCLYAIQATKPSA